MSYYSGNSAAKHNFDLCRNAFVSQICDNAKKSNSFHKKEM